MDRIRVYRQIRLEYASVDAQIFKSATKKLRIQKYLDTCGRGLNCVVILSTASRSEGELEGNISNFDFSSGENQIRIYFVVFFSLQFVSLLVDLEAKTIYIYFLLKS